MIAPVNTVTVTFYSQRMQDRSYGKGATARTYQVPALKAFFCSVKPAEDGWFAARVRMEREKALALYRRVKLAVPDLIAEKEDSAQVPA